MKEIHRLKYGPLAPLLKGNEWRNAAGLTPGLLFGRRWKSTSRRGKWRVLDVGSGVPERTRLSVLCGTLADVERRDLELCSIKVEVLLGCGKEGRGAKTGDRRQAIGPRKPASRREKSDRAA